PWPETGSTRAASMPGRVYRPTGSSTFLTGRSRSTRGRQGRRPPRPTPRGRITVRGTPCRSSRLYFDRHLDSTGTAGLSPLGGDAPDRPSGDPSPPSPSELQVGRERE